MTKFLTESFDKKSTPINCKKMELTDTLLHAKDSFLERNLFYTIWLKTKSGLKQRLFSVISKFSLLCLYQREVITFTCRGFFKIPLITCNSCFFLPRTLIVQAIVRTHIKAKNERNLLSIPFTATRLLACVSISIPMNKHIV